MPNDPSSSAATPPADPSATVATSDTVPASPVATVVTDVPPVTKPETPGAKPATWAAPEASTDPHAVPWVMTRARLVELRACEPGLDMFDERTKATGGVWVLEHGWDDATTRKLALEAPRSLAWYARKGLIPVSAAEARDYIVRAHGGFRNGRLAQVMRIGAVLQ